MWPPQSKPGCRAEKKMNASRIKIHGVYRVPFTQSLLSEAMALKYGGIEMSPSSRAKAEAHVKDELSSVVLIDITVNDDREGFDVGKFGQRQSDQVAYDEVFLSIDGKRIISDIERPPGGTCRLAFFLHYFDLEQPLETPFGPVPLPAPGDMPRDLQKLIAYQPVT